MKTQLVQILNQIFEIEKKARHMPEGRKLDRNLRRLKASLEELGLAYHDPFGEAYNETRTDCEASISGKATDRLVITEVIKPIIHQEVDGYRQLVQRAVVIVEAAS
ncbi:MAG: hypothetical protein AAFR61_22650 [Bacteroidota bacterium]